MAKTKIIADYIRKVTDDDGNIEITMKVSSWNYKRYVQDLEKGIYAVELSKPRSKRSLEQNALLWAVIHEIAEVEDGHLANDWDTYCALLEKANTKYTDIVAPADAEEDIRKIKGMRGVKVIRPAKQDGYLIYRLYPGSSTFNMDEMRKLLDVALDYAAQIGVDTAYYADQRQW